MDRINIFKNRAGRPRTLELVKKGNRINILRTKTFVQLSHNLHLCYLQEAKKVMLVTGNVNVTPLLEEKTIDGSSFYKILRKYRTSFWT